MVRQQGAGTVIFLRGPSGSGKSTTAALSADALRQHGIRVAVVETDYYQHRIFGMGSDRTVWTPLVAQVVSHALASGFVVIVDGCLNVTRPEVADMLLRIEEIAASVQYFFWNVTQQTTIERHLSRQKRHEFGVEEMLTWWQGTTHRSGRADERVVESHDPFIDVAMDVCRRCTAAFTGGGSAVEDAVLLSTIEALWVTHRRTTELGE